MFDIPKYLVYRYSSRSSQPSPTPSRPSLSLEPHQETVAVTLSLKSMDEMRVLSPATRDQMSILEKSVRRSAARTLARVMGSQLPESPLLLHKPKKGRLCVLTSKNALLGRHLSRARNLVSIGGGGNGGGEMTFSSSSSKAISSGFLDTFSTGGCPLSFSSLSSSSSIAISSGFWPRAS